MVTHESSGAPQDKCPNCGKPFPQSSRAGSITSYFSQPFTCTCAATKQPNAPLPDKSDPNFCRVCGLQKSGESAVGSLTGFLFQDTRCKCPPEAEPRPVSEKGWAATAIDLKPGTVIGGIYRIEKMIGRGGMGEVYLAENIHLHKRCALKVIPPDQVTDNTWARFQIEAKAVAGLDQINLVKVTDLGIHGGSLPFYAMEYVDGLNMSQMLLMHDLLPLNTVLDIFTQICDGVDYAHRKGIIHRDLKPANIMLAEAAGGKFTVKILDFGLIKLTGKDRSQQSLTAVGDVFGSPLYMSPEQTLGDKIDNRSDIYSIGCTLFECLTGRPPFVGDNPVKMMNDHQNSDPPSLEKVAPDRGLPHSMEVVIAKLLRKNPVERYQTMLELRGDLQKIARGEEVLPFYMSRAKGGSTPSTEQPRSSARAEAEEPANKLPWIIAAAVVVCTITAGGALFYFKSQLNQKQQIHGTEVNDESEAGYFVRNTAANQKTNAGQTELPPFAHIEKDAGGTSMRVFMFPEDKILGKIGVFGKGQTLNAKGRVAFPADALVSFAPYEIIDQEPNLLSRFRAGDLYEYNLAGPGNSVGDTFTSQGLVEVGSRIPGIKSLDLFKAIDLMDRAVPEIDKYKDITRLMVGDCGIEAPSLVPLHRLNDLTILELLQYENVSPVLQKLQNSQSLLHLSIPNMRLTLEDLRCISKIKQLQLFMFHGLTPNDTATSNEAIKLLGGLKGLSRLTIKEFPIDEQTIDALAELKRLDIIEVDTAVTNFPPALRKKAAKTLPHLTWIDVTGKHIPM